MGNADHDLIIELIPAYALAVLDGDEAEQVQQHLASCHACQGELAAYELVVDALPLATPDMEPSAELKDRLMARVQAPPTAITTAATAKGAASTAQASPWSQIAGTLRGLLTGPRWRPAALIIIIALVVSNLVTWQILSRGSSSSSSWRRVRLAGTEVAPDATGIIYISADGRNGTLIVDGLPVLNQGKQYQLWLINDGQRTSGGVFSVNADGYHGIQISSSQPLKDFGAFGITIEPAGGSPGPTGERVLGSNL